MLHLIKVEDGTNTTVTKTTNEHKTIESNIFPRKYEEMKSKILFFALTRYFLCGFCSLHSRAVDIRKQTFLVKVFQL